MNIKSVLVLLAFGLSACSSGRYAGVPKEYHALIDQTMNVAGDNAKELKKALKEVPRNEREGMAFLISYMPERDAKSLSADFLLENVQYAYKARTEFPWAKEVPDSVFLNDVVAYANLNENRESWRKDFYERFKKYVAPCKTMREAIDSVTRTCATSCSSTTIRSARNPTRLLTSRCASTWLRARVSQSCLPMRSAP